MEDTLILPSAMKWNTEHLSHVSWFNVAAAKSMHADGLKFHWKQCLNFKITSDININWPTKFKRNPQNPNFAHVGQFGARNS